ncbi:MAG: ParA family protein [Chloroflexi bacterium]|nr:ParA family protein [Chloroflexota bacterium]
MPFVIAVCHQKGGVAKTTTTLGLGACLVEKHAETLMIDLDPQANLTASMGINSAETAYSIAEALMGKTDIAKARLETSLPGLDIIPSNAGMFTINRELFLVPDYEYRLRQVLTSAAVLDYEFVLLDCPPSVGPLIINALTAADLLLVPTQCEYFSIQALMDMFELVKVIRDKTNPELVYRLLVTMFDKRGNFHSRMLAQMRDYFNEGLLHTIIGFDTKLREAQAAGQPITIHAPQSQGAEQYRQLAEELYDYVSTKSKI